MSTFLFKDSPLLSERIEQTKGRASGFDYMRLILALIIVCFHSVVTSYGKEAQHAFNQTSWRYLMFMLLPMFFSLSGFLVAGSLERSKGIFVFLGLRAFRIFPALAVDTLFCALIIGPIATTLPLSEYFQHPTFISYFQNILGIIHYYLPGVFEHNPFDQVNGQLWTVPSELECYIALAALSAIGSHRYPRIFFGILLACTALLEGRVLLVGAKANPDHMLVLFFLSGVSIYLLRERIVWDVKLFAIGLAVGMFCLFHDQFKYLSPLPLAYITAYLGLLNPHKIGLLKKGDYSYGLFLYGFPIQQTLVAFVPFTHEWYGNILLAVPCAFAFAALSWHLVEKRVLERKGVLKKIDAWLPANPLANVLGRVAR